VSTREFDLGDSFRAAVVGGVWTGTRPSRDSTRPTQQRITVIAVSFDAVHTSFVSAAITRGVFSAVLTHLDIRVCVCGCSHEDTRTHAHTFQPIRTVLPYTPSLHSHAFTAIHYTRDTFTIYTHLLAGAGSVFAVRRAWVARVIPAQAVTHLARVESHGDGVQKTIWVKTTKIS
jgi:hypothetical protein